MCSGRGVGLAAMTMSEYGVLGEILHRSLHTTECYCEDAVDQEGPRARPWGPGLEGGT